MPTTCGSFALENAKPRKNAAVVDLVYKLQLFAKCADVLSFEKPV